VSLNKWLLGIAHLCQADDAFTGAKLHRLLGVSSQTARFLAHRVRRALAASRSRSRSSAERRSAHERLLRYRAALRSGSQSPNGGWHAKTGNGRAVSFEAALASMMGPMPVPHRNGVPRTRTGAERRPDLRSQRPSGTVRAIRS